MYDIIIIGAGTAGLTAAIYATRNNYKTLVLESTMPGGQIINAMDIENYPGIPKIDGFDFSNTLKKQAIDLGAEYKRENATTLFLKEPTKKVVTNKDEYESKAVIIATGGVPKPLGVDNETAFIGKGVSYCAQCDGNFFKGKDVAVVGGGNTALEDVLFLSNICSKVYLIHRRQEFRGDASNIDAVKKKDNIKLVLDSVVVSILGENILETIIVKDVVTGEEQAIPTSAIFIAIGQTPQSHLVKDIFPLDESGYILAPEDCTTNIPGVFVAGDLRKKPLRQLVTAASDGANAAVSASSYLVKL